MKKHLFFLFFDTNDADLSFIFFFFYDSWIICMEICFRKVHFILVQMDVETKHSKRKAFVCDNAIVRTL